MLKKVPAERRGACPSEAVARASNDPQLTATFGAGLESRERIHRLPQTTPLALIRQDVVCCTDLLARAAKDAIGNFAGRAAASGREKEIEWLQESLNKLLGTWLKLDGRLGERTRDVVKRFQKKNGLQVDDIPGPITKAKIQALPAEEAE